MEVHVEAIPTRVRGRALTRHSASHDSALGLILLTSAGGPPTLWQRAQRIAAQAFRDELGTPEPHAAESQLRRAYASARGALVRFRDSLIGSKLPEVMLLAIVTGPTRVGIVVGGAGRVYHYQVRQHRRLTAFEDLEGGLADNPEPWITSAPVRRGDIVVAGSLEAFELPAIGAMAARLNEEPGVNITTIADILLEPARESGVGAAAAVLRV